MMKQFSNEEIDATLDLDRQNPSKHDPDEMMVKEQRERQLRYRLNQLFKEFASKVKSGTLFINRYRLTCAS